MTFYFCTFWKAPYIHILSWTNRVRAEIIICWFPTEETWYSLHRWIKICVYICTSIGNRVKWVEKYEYIALYSGSMHLYYRSLQTIMVPGLWICLICPLGPTAGWHFGLLFYIDRASKGKKWQTWHLRCCQVTVQSWGELDFDWLLVTTVKNNRFAGCHWRWRVACCSSPRRNTKFVIYPENTVRSPDCSCSKTTRLTFVIFDVV